MSLNLENLVNNFLNLDGSLTPNSVDFVNNLVVEIRDGFNVDISTEAITERFAENPNKLTFEAIRFLVLVGDTLGVNTVVAQNDFIRNNKLTFAGIRYFQDVINAV